MSLNKFKVVYYLTLSFCFILALSTCKKYPENDLWFKAPGKAIDGSWQLELFEIDGNDSLNNNIKIISNSKVKFSLLSKSKLINNVSGHIRVEDDYHFGGSWKLINNKKYIQIYFTSDYEGSTNLVSCPCYNFNNIFAAYKTSINWKIEKLTKNQFWITTNYNGLNYEIHFKK